MSHYKELKKLNIIEHENVATAVATALNNPILFGYDPTPEQLEAVAMAAEKTANLDRAGSWRAAEAYEKWHRHAPHQSKILVEPEKEVTELWQKTGLTGIQAQIIERAVSKVVHQGHHFPPHE